MMIEKKFFKWNERFNNQPVKLGDEITHLLKNNIIFKTGSTYTLKGNENITIGSKDNLVKYIYFTKNSGDTLIDVDSFSFPYPATEPICEYLNKKHECLPFKTIDDAKQNYKGDLLYLIFRDFNPMNVFLMRI